MKQDNVQHAHIHRRQVKQRQQQVKQSSEPLTEPGSTMATTAVTSITTITNFQGYKQNMQVQA